jgi:EmrB/QacA subfamily drug resistance transporter
VSTVGRRTHHQVTFSVLAAGIAAYALLQSLITPVLTTVQQQLHTTQATATWALTGYLLSASVFTPIMGRIGDMRGKKRVFVVTLIALTLGSLLAALATNIDVMIVARAIQGIGGGVLPLAFGIIRDEFPRDKVTGAVGLIASLSAVGAGLGIVLAGPIITSLGFHWLFWIPMIMTGAAAVAAAVLVPESPIRTPGRVSWLPALLMSGWLVALLVALSEAPEWGWASGKVIGLLAATVVLAVVWIRAENSAATPLIDMQMMRRKAVWTNNLVALLIGIGMYATFAFLPEFVQTPRSAGYGFGASITQSGLILLPATVTMFAVAMFAGRMAKRLGGKALVVAGCAIGVGSMAILAFANDQKWELYLSTAIMGAGFGLAFAAMSGLIVSAVPPEQTGVASGMNANIRTIGGSIGAALMASIVTAHVSSAGLPAKSGYTAGFAMLGVGLALAALAGLLIPATDLRNPREDQPEHAELALLPAGTIVGDESE